MAMQTKTFRFYHFYIFICKAKPKFRNPYIETDAISNSLNKREMRDKKKDAFSKDTKNNVNIWFLNAVYVPD